MTVGTTQLAPGNGHNYIINGGFDIWQRGDALSSPGYFYAPDRWRSYGYSGSNTTITREEFTPEELETIGFGAAQYYARGTAAVNRLIFESKIEDVRTLAGQTVTLSFWVRATEEANNLSIRMFQLFGNNGSSTVEFFNQFQSASDTWERKQITVNVPSVAGKTIGPNSHLMISLNYEETGVTVDYWGVQLEAGSVATPFKRNAPSLQGELAACQRYYQLVADGDNQPIVNAVYILGSGTSTDLRGVYTFKTEMRTTPSLEVASGASYYTAFGASGDALDDFNLVFPNSRSTLIRNSTDVSGNSGSSAYIFTNNANAFVAFDAEL